jgi:hypothetical protein
MNEAVIVMKTKNKLAVSTGLTTHNHYSILFILPGLGEGQNSDRLDRQFEFVEGDSLSDCFKN